MNLHLRELHLDDKPAVVELCSKVWEDDYVPDRFVSWMEDPLWLPIGCYEDGALVGIAALQKVEGTDIGWVKALRVNEESRNRHIGSHIVESMIEHAPNLGIRTLWYATSSRNASSMALAERMGFALVNQVGYLRLYRPFPPHPKPSPNYHPLIIDASRLAVILSETPELVGASTIPLAWEFDHVNPDGLARLSKRAEFKAMIAEDGVTKGLYYRYDRERRGIKTAAYGIFSNDRTVFVDMIARILDEIQDSDADRAVFFLGRNAHEWIEYTVPIPEEYVGRKFILYELSLAG